MRHIAFFFLLNVTPQKGVMSQIILLRHDIRSRDLRKPKYEVF